MQQERYDVVVIGSGIAGLCAGALLARGGYKTLVVEKLSRIGGRCSTEEYEGFKLPTGAITIHTGAGMDETFRELGVDLELVMVPRLLWRIEGKDYLVQDADMVKFVFKKQYFHEFLSRIRTDISVFIRAKYPWTLHFKLNFAIVEIIDTTLITNF